MNNERVHEKVFLYSISSRWFISGFSSGLRRTWRQKAALCNGWSRKESSGKHCKRLTYIYKTIYIHIYIVIGKVKEFGERQRVSDYR